MLHRILKIAGLCTLLSGWACHNPDKHTVHRAFYYWRTVFNLDEQHQEELRSQDISRLYTRFFDVVYNAEQVAAVPEADIVFQTKVGSNLDLVPVVYITNEALIHLSDTAVPLLSERLLNRMKHIFLTTGALKLKEVQLDCDWTGETKDKYFSLIRALKEKVHARGITLSTTIRLHQIKYFARTGVPPADRGMLMFYNMGKVDDIHTANSIYDASTASRYLVNFTTYPLPLDIALPCFSWAVVFRESHIAALLSNKAKTDLDQEEGLERTDATHYRVKHEFKIGTVSLTPEETVRLEQVDPELCDKAAQQIAPFLRDQELYVSVFQLKKNQPDIHEKKILDQIYCRFK